MLSTDDAVTRSEGTGGRIGFIGLIRLGSESLIDSLLSRSAVGDLIEDAQQILDGESVGDPRCEGGGEGPRQCRAVLLKRAELGTAGVDAPENGLPGARSEGGLTGDGEQEHTRAGVPVDVGAGLVAVEHLRRDEAGGAGDLTGLRQTDVVGDLGDAEVDENRALRAEHDVGRFEIAVDDTGGVDRRQRVDQPVGQVRQIARVGGQVVGALVVDLVLKGGPVDELGDDEGDAGPVGAITGLDIEDAGDAGIPDARQDRGLPVQTAPRHGIRGDLRVKDLHGDVVARAIGDLPDHAHTAGPQPPDQPVSPDLGAGAKSRQGNRSACSQVRVLRHDAHSTGHPRRDMGCERLHRHPERVEPRRSTGPCQTCDSMSPARDRPAERTCQCGHAFGTFHNGSSGTYLPVKGYHSWQR